MNVLLAIDLFCGLGGWTDGLIAEGYDVVGFDVERHDYGTGGYPAQLVIQDVLTIHGRQFRDAALIVASPPCQRYSWMAMPFSRGKREARWQRWERDSPFGDFHLNDLFDACFRIQREACEAAGRYIPMVVENVKGAQPWVGRAKANFGSFYLWGDVAMVGKRVVCGGTFGSYAQPTKVRKVDGFNFHEHEKTGKPGRSFQSAAVEGTKAGGDWFGPGTSPHWTAIRAGSTKVVGHANICDGHTHTRHLTNQWESDAVKQPGMPGSAWFDKGAASFSSSSSSSRQAASAQIAKIPLELSSYVARSYLPPNTRAQAASDSASYKCLDKPTDSPMTA